MVGAGDPDGGRQGIHRYYKCRGREPISSAHQPRCTRLMVRAEDLEVAVWGYIRRPLDDPGMLASQFEAFARRDGDPAASARAEDRKWAAQLRRPDHEETRLVDAYQAAVISLEEPSERRQGIRDRRRVLITRRDQQTKLRTERLAVQAVWKELTGFCERIRTRLDQLAPEEQRRVLRLLVERVIVGDDSLEIRHLIPLRALGEEASPLAESGVPSGVPDAEGASSGRPVQRLRSDRVPLPLGLGVVVTVPGDLGATAREAPHAVRPAHQPHGLEAFGVVDQGLGVDHRRASPGRNRLSRRSACRVEITPARTLREPPPWNPR
jgi:hypothetical protein